MSKPRRTTLPAILTASLFATAAGGADEPQTPPNTEATEVEKKDKVKELDEQDEKQWKAIPEKFKQLQEFKTAATPPEANAKPMVDAVSEIDKALGEPPAKKPRPEPKVPAPGGLSEVVSDLKVIVPTTMATEPAPVPSRPGSRGRTARDVVEILYRRSRSTQPALLPQAQPAATKDE